MHEPFEGGLQSEMAWESTLGRTKRGDRLGGARSAPTTDLKRETLEKKRPRGVVAFRIFAGRANRASCESDSARTRDLALLKALPAENRPSLCWTERNCCFFSAR